MRVNFCALFIQISIDPPSGERGVPVPAGAAEPAPSGGGGRELHAVSDRGDSSAQQGPRDWLCQTAGAAAPSGGSALHEVKSVGARTIPAGAAEPALPGRRRSAPSGSSPAHEVTSVGAKIIPAGAAEPALPGRRRSAPSGGSALHEVKSVGANIYASLPNRPEGRTISTRTMITNTTIFEASG